MVSEREAMRVLEMTCSGLALLPAERAVLADHWGAGRPCAMLPVGSIWTQLP